MICYDFVEKFCSEPDRDLKQQILDEGYSCIQQQESRRIGELYDFIDAFVQSEEYLEYVKEKKRIVKQNEYTQYDPDDTIVEYRNEAVVDRYPLTEERKKMYAFKEQFQRFTERQKMIKNRQIQEKSIQIIKVPIFIKLVLRY